MKSNAKNPRRRREPDEAKRHGRGVPPRRGQSPDYGGDSLRGTQITAEANHEMKNVGFHLIDYLNDTGRTCDGKPFGVSTFYNALILGVFDFHFVGDIDPKEIAEKGILETIIDRGAYIYAKKKTPELFGYASEQEARRKKTAEPPVDEEEARPERKAIPSLMIPQDFMLSGNRRRNVVRAEEK